MTLVWIEKDLCMGAGTCEQIAPGVFQSLTDGTWAVKEDERYFGRTLVFDGSDPAFATEGHHGRARVPQPLLENVIEAAEECPAQCIYVEG